MEKSGPTDPHAEGAAKRVRLTSSERRAHVLRWKRSGGSAAEYAHAHGLRAANLYAWHAKERAESDGSPLADSNTASFIPLRLAGGNGFGGASPRVRLKGDGDLECVIEGAGGPEGFAAIAAALKREVFDV